MTLGATLMKVMEPMEPGPIDAVVFDVGGVLIDWDPRHLYRKIFHDADWMETFLSQVCTPAWHGQHDLGVPFSASIPALTTEHPEWADEIRAWADRFAEMWKGPVPGSVEVFAALRASDNRPPIYAATNWGSDNWKLAKTLFPFLEWFDGELVSADVGLLKPNPRFFELLMRRFRLTPSSTLYIDDNTENIKQACQTGFVVHHFTDAHGLTRRLEQLALIP
jgi:2-haloacid dehalogenase